MRDAAFSLEPAARVAQPPFSYDWTVARGRRLFWNVRDATGRRVARANTRAGARAAVRALWAAAAPMREAA